MLCQQMFKFCVLVIDTYPETRHDLVCCFLHHFRWLGMTSFFQMCLNLKQRGRDRIRGRVEEDKRRGEEEKGKRRGDGEEERKKRGRGEDGEKRRGEEEGKEMRIT